MTNGAPSAPVAVILPALAVFCLLDSDFCSSQHSAIGIPKSAWAVSGHGFEGTLGLAQGL